MLHVKFQRGELVDMYARAISGHGPFIGEGVITDREMRYEDDHVFVIYTVKLTSGHSAGQEKWAYENQLEFAA